MKHFACEAFKKEMRLRVDFNNMMSGFVKGGITPEELEATQRHMRLRQGPWMKSAEA